MNITILGLWHLGSVTAACCAKHFSVTGLDFDTNVIANFQLGKAPLHEPGLNALIAAGISSNSLSFTSDPISACLKADILWLTYDTPVNANDESDIHSVLNQLYQTIPHLKQGCLILISSQLPVGTCLSLEAQYPQFSFAYSPENLQLGKAISNFENPDRIIVGTRGNGNKDLLCQLFAPFTSQIIFVRTESAEMIKHALNSFFALSITFINEISRLCELTGASAKEVSAGLKSDVRIGAKAYLAPGGPFAGGTLARDVVTLTKLAKEKEETLFVLPAIKQSNDAHRSWALKRLQEKLVQLKGKKIAILGLTYKANTNTLRRSAAVELIECICKEGGTVNAYDPTPISFPQINGLISCKSVAEALSNADAIVICTDHQEFLEVSWNKVVPTMRRRLVVDANQFLGQHLQGIEGIEHLSVGGIQKNNET